MNVSQPRLVVVTAAGQSYADLLEGCLDSLVASAALQRFDIACFDLGLAEATVERLASRVNKWVTPDWDLDVSEAARERSPALRALTVRPFLTRYFPGYDIYLWIDSDVWVQRPEALGLYVNAAAAGAMVVVPHAHLAYTQTDDKALWRLGRLRTYYGQAAARRLLVERYVNAGVFALRADAPHWSRWAHWFAQGLSAAEGRLCCDQTALNHMLWTDQLPAVYLPATSNWLCHLALPAFDPARGVFCTPDASHEAIDLLHLSAGVRQGEITPIGGSGRCRMSLCYTARRGLVA